MCGIAGYVSESASRLRASDAAMLDAVAYRGPDARTVWSDDRQVTLHHARLSIIDLECGGQPMTDVSGRYTIVFNGAIYNYTELRAEYVAAGAAFKTQSDTEVLLNGFALKGEKVVRDLNGMFAFAIWDAVDRRLFLARDRLGKKPLFWTKVADTFAFASSINAFRRLPGWNDTLSRAGLTLYSFLGGFPADVTAFANAKALPGAHTAWYAPGDARPALTRYWLPRYDVKATANTGERLEEYTQLIADATRIRLRSDVPVALSFSGGVDSGTIAAVAKAHCNIDLQCYTIDYHTAAEPSPDVQLAQKVAARLGLPWAHVQYDYRAELLEGLGAAYPFFDQPCQQLALVYSYRLYQHMAQQCRVVLSGNGADELFTGYAGDEAQSQFDRARRWLRRLPSFAYNALPQGVRSRCDPIRLDALTMPEWGRRDMLAYAAQFATEADVLDECRAAINGIADEFAAAGIDSQMDYVMHRALIVSATDTNFRLPDITGYAAHVEVRSPFLDHRMVEFAARLPHALKVGVRGGRLRPKFLPRLAYSAAVGDDVSWAPKFGMGANLHWPREFVRNPKFAGAIADAYTALPDAGIDVTRFGAAFDAFRAAVGRGDTVYPTGGTMMNGFMLGAWLRLVHQPEAA
jgi:asparagine synthase (glutamine-hydrolysing)